MPEQEVPSHSHAPDIEELATGVTMEQLQALALGLHQDDFMGRITPITTPTTPAAPSTVYALGFATEIGVAWQFTKLVGSRVFGVEVRRATQANMSDAVSLGEFQGFFLIDDNNHRLWGVSTTRYYQVRTVARSGETIYFSGWTPATPVSGTTLAAGSSNTDLQTRMDTFAAAVQELHLLPGAINLSALSQAVSVVSNAVSALEVRVSALSAGGGVSVTSTELSAVSAQAASALSQALSVVGVTDAALSAAINVVSNTISNLTSAHNVLSNRVSANSGVASVTSQEMSVADAALSVRVDIQSQAISVLSQGISVVSQALSAQAAALSVRVDTQSQALSVLSQSTSVKFDVLSARIEDLTTWQISALSQAVSVLNQQVSVLSQAVSILSQSVSVQAAALSVRINTQSQSISVLSQQVSVISQKLSGLSVIAGNLDISGVLSVRGGQIAFPATQNPSAGANTLDDYEEGTWTPSNGGSTTYTSRIGNYTKVGNLAYLQAQDTINVLGTGSVGDFTGAPFSAGAIFSGVVAYWSGSATSFVFFGCFISGTTIYLTGTTAAATGVVQSPTFFQNGADIRLSIFYVI